jgi:hypothetical protein
MNPDAKGGLGYLLGILLPDTKILREKNARYPDFQVFPSKYQGSLIQKNQGTTKKKKKKNLSVGIPNLECLIPRPLRMNLVLSQEFQGRIYLVPRLMLSKYKCQGKIGHLRGSEVSYQDQLSKYEDTKY